MWPTFHLIMRYYFTKYQKSKEHIETEINVNTDKDKELSPN